LNITLHQGVPVPDVFAISPGGGAVNAANATGPSSPDFAPVTITANNAEITNNSFPTSGNQTGLRIQSAGSATITASGPITVAGGGSSWAILDIAQGGLGPAMVTYGQPNAPGLGITVGPLGPESGCINVNNRANGNAIIDSSGDITGFAGAGQSGFYGLIARAGDNTSVAVPGPLTGDTIISYHSGTINFTGDNTRGMLAWSQGDGSAMVTTDPGTKIILSAPNSSSPGVYAFAGIATAANGRTVTANVASEIMNSGPATSPGTGGPYGIRADSSADAPISVTYTGPGITTQGMNGVGIGSGTPAGTGVGSGSVDVASSGPITTNGSGAFGILAQSRGGPIAVTTSGQGTITTRDLNRTASLPALQPAMCR
jgi:hypothetical protein